LLTPNVFNLREETAEWERIRWESMFCKLRHDPPEGDLREKEKIGDDRPEMLSIRRRSEEKIITRWKQKKEKRIEL